MNRGENKMLTMKDFFTEENIKQTDKMIDSFEEYYGLKLPIDEKTETDE